MTLRAFILLLTVSVLACSNNESINYETMSFIELGEMFPGSYNDIELSKTDERLWIGEDGEPYSELKKSTKLIPINLCIHINSKMGFYSKPRFIMLTHRELQPLQVPLNTPLILKAT